MALSLNARDVVAVIPTRGDVNLSPVLHSLPFDRAVVQRGTNGLFGRYQAAAECGAEYIYTQDDDCIVDAAALLKQFDGGGVLCNMPVAKRAEYPDGIALVGWGALFHKSALAVFERYLGAWPADALFYREMDRVFTGLNQCRLAEADVAHLPHAHGSDRMSLQSDHLRRLGEIRERIYAVRGYRIPGV